MDTNPCHFSPWDSWHRREQVRGTAVFSSGVVGQWCPDEHLVTRDDDRSAKFVTRGRRRIEEGVLEVTGGRVEQIGGTAVYSSGVVVKCSDEHLIARNGDR